MSTASGEPNPRDPRLVAALRHAPDRHAQPPSLLDRRILAEARRGSPARAPRSTWQTLQDLLQALTRPAAGAALASVVLATTVVLLWRDAPAPVTSERAAWKEAPAAVAPPAAPEPAAPAPITPARQPAPETSAKRERAPQAQRVLRKSETQPAAGLEATVAVAVAPPAPAPPSPSPSPSPSPPAPAAAKTAPPAPQTATPAAEATATADTLTLSGTVAGNAAQRSPMRALRSSAAARDVGPPPAELLQAMQVASPLARALHEVAGRPELQVAWSREWRSIERSAPSGGDLPLHDASGALLGHLRLDAEAIVWLPASGAAAGLTLNTAALATLRAAAAGSAPASTPPR